MPFLPNDPLVLADWNGTVWEVDQPLTYIIDSTTQVTVPIGFPTDLASIPQIVWNIFPPQGGSWANYGPAAVIHDYLYRYATITNTQTNNKIKINKQQADNVLNQAMIDLNVPKWVRFIIYSGVRIGGFVAWNKWRKLEAQRQ